MASYSNIVSAIAKAVSDARLKVLDDVEAYVLDKVDEDSAEAIKELFNDFKEKFTKDIEEEMKEMKKKGRKSAKTADGEKRTRKPTPYNVFVSETMKRFKVENPTFNGKQIMKMAMEAWKAMSDEEKTAYREKVTRQQSTTDEESTVDADESPVEEPPKPAKKPAAKGTKSNKGKAGKAKPKDEDEDSE